MQAHALHLRPTTRLGRWSLVLALGFFVFNLLWRFSPVAHRSHFSAASPAALRAWSRCSAAGSAGSPVYATFFPLLAVVGFVLAELLIGHD